MMIQMLKCSRLPHNLEDMPALAGGGQNTLLMTGWTVQNSQDKFRNDKVNRPVFMTQSLNESSPVFCDVNVLK